jgi:hypothetical protein
MTVLVDLAIKEFIEKCEVDFAGSQDPNAPYNFEMGDRGDMM